MLTRLDPQSEEERKAIIEAGISMPVLAMSSFTLFISCQINLVVSSFMLRRAEAPS